MYTYFRGGGNQIGQFEYYYYRSLYAPDSPLRFSVPNNITTNDSLRRNFIQDGINIIIIYNMVTGSWSNNIV